MAKVIVFGTFDILHEGHKNFFKQAKRYGDIYAVIARDSSVKKIKGFTPEQNEKTRQSNVRKCKEITEALLGNEDDYYAIIEKINPDIICLGYDQNEMELKEELKKRNLHPQIYRLNPYQPEQYKSSIMKRELKRRKEEIRSKDASPSRALPAV